MKNQLVLFATGALTLSAFGIVAPASADLVTRCVGEGGAVTVPGDLVVPRGAACSLTGTTVTGDVRVAAGADLVAVDVTVDGRVVVADDAYLDTTGTTVAGEVILSGAFGGYFEGSEIGDRVVTRASASTDTGGFAYAVGSRVTGDLVSRSAEVFAEDSELGGLVSTDSLYADLYSSFVDGTVLVRANEQGSTLCNVAVQGTSRFQNNTGAVQLGSDGPGAACAAGSFWGDDVTVTGTTGGAFVDGNIIDGDLTLRDNDPVALVGQSNLVRGEIRGDFEEWDGTDPSSIASTSEQGSDPQQRRATLEDKVEQRQQQARKSAEQAGAADLG